MAGKGNKKKQQQPAKPQPAPSKSARRRMRRRMAGQATGGGLEVFTLSGTDVAASISVSKDTAAGTVLLNKVVHPLLFPGTRLGMEAQLWDRWVPERLDFEVVSSASLVIFGMLTFGWSADPTVNLVGKSLDNVSRVASCSPSTTFSIHQQRAVLRVPVISARKWYDTDLISLSNAAHGALLMVVAGGIGSMSGSFSLVVTCRWRIRFEGRKLPLSISPSSQDIYPDAEWRGYPLFTTSYSSFSSEVLTIKAHEGGAGVTYSAAKAGKVYKIKEGYTLKFRDSTGDKDITYASLAKGFSQPLLVFHSSFNNATAYQKDGTASKCIQYFAAGPYGSADVCFTETSSAELKVNELTERISVLERRLTAALRLGSVLDYDDEGGTSRSEVQDWVDAASSLDGSVATSDPSSDSFSVISFAGNGLSTDTLE